MTLRAQNQREKTIGYLSFFVLVIQKKWTIYTPRVISLCYSSPMSIKADMKSYKSLETAAIFYSSEPFLKQGICLVLCHG